LILVKRDKYLLCGFTNGRLEVRPQTNEASDNPVEYFISQHLQLCKNEERLKVRESFILAFDMRK
jgi:hypothetical protein